MNTYIIAMLLGYSTFYLLSLHPYFKDRYFFKDDAVNNEKPFTDYFYDYLILKDVWCSRRAYNFLRRDISSKRVKHSDIVSSDEDILTEYYNYREFQFAVLEHYTAILFAVIDGVLYAASKLITVYILPVPFGLLVLAFLEAVVRNILAYPMMKRDMKKIRSFTYHICKEGSIISDCPKKLPDLWKLSTLLDVYYRLGEAKIRYCEAGNYLIYTIKNEVVAIILLDKSFEFLPEYDVKDESFKYNDSLEVYVKQIIVIDKYSKERLPELTGFVLAEDIKEIIKYV